MKIIFKSSVFLLLVMMSIVDSSSAQDTTLPQGNSRILLFSGKEIKNAILWKIDSSKVEYVKNGNLGDVNTAEVQSIEAAEFLILFDNEKKMLKRHYDLIIPYNGDSIWCFIQREDDRKILFSEKGSEKTRIILKGAVKEYIQWSEQKDKKADVSVPLTPENTMVDSIVPKDIIIPARTNREEFSETNRKTEASNNLESYYYQSYQRGVNDAAAMNQSRWGVRAFFLGLIYGAPYVSVAAAHSTEPYVVIPEGVDAKLYKTGFQNAATMKKTRNATRGAAISKGVVTLVILLVIVS